ncbi:hypothetical protein D3C78_1281890 [compost metagenome]
MHPELAEQNALRRIWLVQRQGYRHHPAALELAVHPGGQQGTLSVVAPRHRRCGTHAVGQRRGRLQGHQQLLDRAGRQGDAAGQHLAVGALDLHIEGQRPIHRVLHTQADGAGLRPVPCPRLRRQTQARTGVSVEGHATQALAFRSGVAAGFRQGSTARDQRRGIVGAGKVEKDFRADLPGKQWSGKHQRHDGR